MDFSKTPIDSLDRAKQYFQAMGCSSFHMGREYPGRYQEYRGLGISKETERQWTAEAVARAAARLRDPATKPSDLWSVHSRMEDLVQSLRTTDALRQIAEATEHISTRLPARSKVLTAETIVGRSRIEYRRGLIFLAYDLGEKTTAQRLAQIAEDLCRSSLDANVAVERCRAAMQTCAEIRSLLNIP